MAPTMQSKRIGRRITSCGTSSHRERQHRRHRTSTCLPTLSVLATVRTTTEGSVPRFAQLYCVNDYNTLRWDCKSGEVRGPRSCPVGPAPLACTKLLRAGNSCRITRADRDAYAPAFAGRRLWQRLCCKPALLSARCRDCCPLSFPQTVSCPDLVLCHVAGDCGAEPKL